MNWEMFEIGDININTKSSTRITWNPSDHQGYFNINDDKDEEEA